MIGERLGKWVIFKELGRGGMGRVYLAQEELTGKQAALKVLAAELAQEVGFLYRFQREIEALATLDHPHVVRFYESGLENGHYFYAMEYVEGPSLEGVVHEQGRLPWPDVLNIALQITSALRHVHDHGIIHRDLKPSNLLRAGDGTVKLTDFGIAKVFASRHLTATGGIVGSAEFLSPEQAAGKVVGQRSDLYSFGAVLYALLTGRPPFQGESYVELLHKHRYGQFDRPQRLVPELPHELDELVCQLLEKDPDKRPRDARALQKQLETIQRRLERKAGRTMADTREEATRAENRADLVSADKLPGPATLMSRLMRSELDRQNHGGPVSRFFNRPWVLATLLALCVGLLVWTFWPLGEEQLFERGARLMESGRLADMEEAWRDYLGPLEERFPGHPYAEQVAQFRQSYEAAKSPLPSEAQRFYQQGEALRRQGQLTAAGKVWQNLIAAFGGVEAEAEWVRRAEQALTELETAATSRERLKQIRPALDRAAELRRAGRPAEAERIWAALEELYRDDPAAATVLGEVTKARQR